MSLDREVKEFSVLVERKCSPHRRKSLDPGGVAQKYPGSSLTQDCRTASLGATQQRTVSDEHVQSFAGGLRPPGGQVVVPGPPWKSGDRSVGEQGSARRSQRKRKPQKASPSVMMSSDSNGESPDEDSENTTTVSDTSEATRVTRSKGVADVNTGVGVASVMGVAKDSALEIPIEVPKRGRGRPRKYPPGQAPVQKRIQRLKKSGVRSKRRYELEDRRRSLLDTSQTSESSESEIDRKARGRKRGRPSYASLINSESSSSKKDEDYTPVAKKPRPSPSSSSSSHPVAEYSAVRGTALASILTDIPEVGIMPLASITVGMAMSSMESPGGASQSVPPYQSNPDPRLVVNHPLENLMAASSSQAQSSRCDTVVKRLNLRNTADRRSRASSSKSATPTSTPTHSPMPPNQGNALLKPSEGKESNRTQNPMQDPNVRKTRKSDSGIKGVVANLEGGSGTQSLSNHFRFLMSLEDDCGRGCNSTRGSMLYTFEHCPEKLRGNEPWINKARAIWNMWRTKVPEHIRKNYIERAKQNKKKFLGEVSSVPSPRQVANQRRDTARKLSAITPMTSRLKETSPLRFEGPSPTSVPSATPTPRKSTRSEPQESSMVDESTIDNRSKSHSKLLSIPNGCNPSEMFASPPSTSASSLSQAACDRTPAKVGRHGQAGAKHGGISNDSGGFRRVVPNSLPVSSEATSNLNINENSTQKQSSRSENLDSGVSTQKQRSHREHLNSPQADKPPEKNGVRSSTVQARVSKSCLGVDNLQKYQSGAQHSRSTFKEPVPQIMGPLDQSLYSNQVIATIIRRSVPAPIKACPASLLLAHTGLNDKQKVSGEGASFPSWSSASGQEANRSNVSAQPADRPNISRHEAYISGQEDSRSTISGEGARRSQGQQVSRSSVTVHGTNVAQKHLHKEKFLGHRTDLTNWSNVLGHGGSLSGKAINSGQETDLSRPVSVSEQGTNLICRQSKVSGQAAEFPDYISKHRTNLLCGPNVLQPSLSGKSNASGQGTELPGRSNDSGQVAELPGRSSDSGQGAELPGRLNYSGQGTELPGRLNYSGQGAELPGRSNYSGQVAELSRRSSVSGQVAELQRLSNNSRQEAELTRRSSVGRVTELPKRSDASGKAAKLPRRSNLSRKVVRSPRKSRTLEQVSELPKRQNVSDDMTELPRRLNMSGQGKDFPSRPDVSMLKDKLGVRSNIVEQLVDLHRRFRGSGQSAEIPGWDKGTHVLSRPDASGQGGNFGQRSIVSGQVTELSRMSNVSEKEATRSYGPNIGRISSALAPAADFPQSSNVLAELSRMSNVSEKEVTRSYVSQGPNLGRISSASAPAADFPQSSNVSGQVEVLPRQTAELSEKLTTSGQGKHSPMERKSSVPSAQGTALLGLSSMSRQDEYGLSSSRVTESIQSHDVSSKSQEPIGDVSEVPSKICTSSSVPGFFKELWRSTSDGVASLSSNSRVCQTSGANQLYCSFTVGPETVLSDSTSFLANCGGTVITITKVQNPAEAPPIHEDKDESDFCSVSQNENSLSSPSNSAPYDVMVDTPDGSFSGDKYNSLFTLQESPSVNVASSPVQAVHVDSSLNEYCFGVEKAVNPALASPQEINALCASSDLLSAIIPISPNSKQKSLKLPALPPSSQLPKAHPIVANACPPPVSLPVTVEAISSILSPHKTTSPRITCSSSAKSRSGQADHQSLPNMPLPLMTPAGFRCYPPQSLASSSASSSIFSNSSASFQSSCQPPSYSTTLSEPNHSNIRSNSNTCTKSSNRSQKRSDHSSSAGGNTKKKASRKKQVKKSASGTNMEDKGTCPNGNLHVVTSASGYSITTQQYSSASSWHGNLPSSSSSYVWPTSDLSCNSITHHSADHSLPATPVQLPQAPESLTERSSPALSPHLCHRKPAHTASFVIPQMSSIAPPNSLDIHFPSSLRETCRAMHKVSSFNPIRMYDDEEQPSGNEMEPSCSGMESHFRGHWEGAGNTRRPSRAVSVVSPMQAAHHGFPGRPSRPPSISSSGRSSASPAFMSHLPNNHQSHQTVTGREREVHADWNHHGHNREGVGEADYHISNGRDSGRRLCNGHSDATSQEFVRSGFRPYSRAGEAGRRASPMSNSSARAAVNGQLPLTGQHSPFGCNSSSTSEDLHTGSPVDRSIYHSRRNSIEQSALSSVPARILSPPTTSSSNNSSSKFKKSHKPLKAGAPLASHNSTLSPMTADSPQVYIREMGKVELPPFSAGHGHPSPMHQRSLSIPCSPSFVPREAQGPPASHQSMVFRQYYRSSASSTQCIPAIQPHINRGSPLPKTPNSDHPFGPQDSSSIDFTKMNRWELEQLHYYIVAIMKHHKQMLQGVEERLKALDSRSGGPSPARLTRRDVYNRFLGLAVQPDCSSMQNDESYRGKFGYGPEGENLNDLIQGGTPECPIINPKYDIYGNADRHMQS